VVFSSNDKGLQVPVKNKIVLNIAQFTNLLYNDCAYYMKQVYFNDIRRQSHDQSNTKRTNQTLFFIMATHQCTGCLCDTIKGASTVESPLVVATSECTAPGGPRHTWVPIISCKTWLE
jgi:hypothetical protein